MTPGSSPAAETSFAPGPRRRSRLRRVVVFLVVAFAVAIVLTGIDAYVVARRINAGRAGFATVADDVFAGTGGLTPRARNAAESFSSARSRAYASPWLGAWARVPLLGRPARWLRATANGLDDLASHAAASVARIEPKIETARDPAGRLAFLTLVERELTELRRATRSFPLTRTGGFIPPVNAADRALRADLTRVRDALDDGVVVARGLRSLLAGPSRYLVLAANNAEMRAGGMVLQAGVLRAAGGRVDVGDFATTAALQLKEPVPLAAEFAALYGWLDPGAEWRNVGSSPNFPAVAPIYAAMGERAGLGGADGVIQIDVAGVRALLDVLGPVQAGGRRFTAANVQRLILHDLYVAYGDQQSARRQGFSDLAVATFDALNERSWDVGELARALQKAASGRHLMAWSRRPADQAAWRHLRVDGRLDRDGVMVTVQNHGGNKLDWFVYPDVAVTVERPRGRLRRMHLRVTVHNPTPAGQPDYVRGDGSIVPRDAYRALIAVYLPGWATNVELEGGRVALVGADGAMRVIGTRLDVARGGAGSIEVVFSIPQAVDHVVVLPSARARPVRYTGPKDEFGDAFPRSLRF